jgi:hypothetical protein
MANDIPDDEEDLIWYQERTKAWFAFSVLASFIGLLIFWTLKPPTMAENTRSEVLNTFQTLLALAAGAYLQPTQSVGAMVKRIKDHLNGEPKPPQAPDAA